MYLINEVSRQVNLSQKRIREYEKEGFIKPVRAEKTQNRLYTDFDIIQIKQINELIHERGFTLACLKSHLALAPCWNVFGCERKTECPAYHDPHTPCYIVREKAETPCPGPCDKCAVYLTRDMEKTGVLAKG